MREHIRVAGGSVAFEEFMRFAVYDPEHGYYSRQVRTVGREGDFSTSATLHPALADAVAAWAAHHRADGMTPDKQWHLIELGGGSGEVAARVLGSLGWWARRRVRYHLVEVSAGLRAAQETRLAPWRGRIFWHETMADAIRVSKGTALIFSNEFVDAFPCARWVLGADAVWREIRVAWPDGSPQPAEILGAAVPAADLASASVAEPVFTSKMPAGQRVEVHASYQRWQQEQLGDWVRGRLLTIDYGDLLPGLYHRRPAGTLRAYCRQMRFTGNEVYLRIGRQDLTADVNFVDLHRWGTRLGLDLWEYGAQAGFLKQWLPAKRARNEEHDPGLAYVTDPEGAGGAFKVLEQTRGLPPPVRPARTDRTARPLPP